MVRALIAALMLTAGCAADTGAPRWHREPITLAGPEDVPADVLLRAAHAWSAHGPVIAVVLSESADITVRWGEPERGVAGERTGIDTDGEIRFSTITLLEGERWGDAEADPYAYDLQAVLTHEIGHSLGLEHIDDPDACMYAEVTHGDVGPRELSAADIDAVRALYP